MANRIVLALAAALFLVCSTATAEEADWKECSAGGMDKAAIAEQARKADAEKDNLELAFKAGALYASIQDGDNAKKYLGKVLEKDKDNKQGLASRSVYVLGKCLFMKTQNYQAAADQLEQIKKYFPNSPEARGINVLLATAYLQAKREGQAVKLMRKAIETNPNEPVPYLEFARFSQLNGYKLPEGLENGQKAADLNPADPEAWAVLSQIQYDLAKYPESLKSAQEAAKLAPGEARYAQLVEKSKKMIKSDTPQK